MKNEDDELSRVFRKEYSYTGNRARRVSRDDYGTDTQKLKRGDEIVVERNLVYDNHVVIGQDMELRKTHYDNGKTNMLPWKAMGQRKGDLAIRQNAEKKSKDHLDPSSDLPEKYSYKTRQRFDPEPDIEPKKVSKHEQYE